MRTVPSQLTNACPYCNSDHDPGIQCREKPESVRFQLNPVPTKKSARPVADRTRLHRALDAVLDRRARAKDVACRKCGGELTASGPGEGLCTKCAGVGDVKQDWRGQARFYNTRKRGDKVIYVPDGKVYTIVASGGNPACDNYYTLLGTDGTKKYTDNIDELKPAPGGAS